MPRTRDPETGQFVKTEEEEEVIQDPETGQVLKKVVTWETNWDLDELKFRTPDGIAKYVFVGTIPFKRELTRVTETMRGIKTWETAGYEEVFIPGVCQDCGKRLFQCTTHPIRADEEVGDRVVHFKKSGPREPPDTFCGKCIRKDPEIKAALDEAEYQKNRVKTEYELFLEKKTAEYGGVV